MKSPARRGFPGKARSSRIYFDDPLPDLLS